MNSLRKLVAGPKVRTVENGYDLDLTYVTSRVIAMAFPGSGFEALYRNSIDDVVDFITKKHGDNFMIFNLSGRKYDYAKFKGKVKEWDWEDHQAPALYTIFEICHQAGAYLEQNNDNVVIMHCNHGKGRTGTIIVSLLLFANFFTHVDEALQFYSKRRFQQEGYGVTQPCQIRYIQYFHALLLHKKMTLIPYCLREVRFKGTYSLEDCYLTAKNVRNKQALFKSAIADRGRILIQNKYLMMGDIFLQIMSSNLFGDKQIGRINFNTIFIPTNGVVTFKATEISPDNLLKKHKDKVKEDFELELTFERYCACDLSQVKSDTEIKCKCQQLLSEQRMYWQKIYLILKTYVQPTKEKCIQMLFGGDVHQFRQ